MLETLGVEALLELIPKDQLPAERAGVISALERTKASLAKSREDEGLLEEQVRQYNQARHELFKQRVAERGLRYCSVKGHLVHASLGEMRLIFKAGRNRDGEYQKILSACSGCYREQLRRAASSPDFRMHDVRRVGDDFEYDGPVPRKFPALEVCIELPDYILSEWEEELGLPRELSYFPYEHKMSMGHNKVTL